VTSRSWTSAAGPGLLVLVDLGAVSAVGGAIALLATGGLGMPRSMLAGSPFVDFVGPALLLLTVVGGTQVAAAVLLHRRHRAGPALAASAGFVMMTWILIETAIIRGFSLLQAVYYLAGAGEVVLVLVVLGVLGRTRRNLLSTIEPAPV